MSTILVTSPDSTLYPEEIFAFILLTTNNCDTISGLSQKILDLKKNKIDTSLIALRSSPDGVYSEDMDRYTSFLLTFKYAQQKSPIRLTDKGISLCQSVAKKAVSRNPQVAKEVARILGYNIATLAP